MVTAAMMMLLMGRGRGRPVMRRRRTDVAEMAQSPACSSCTHRPRPENLERNLDRPSIKVFVPLAKPARKHARTAVKIMSGQQMGLKQLALLVHPDKSRHPRTGPSSRQGFRAQKCSCREAVVYVGFWGT